MNTTQPTLDDILDEVIAALAGFLRATDSLTRAINDRNAAAMCEALQDLGTAREQTLRIVGREPVSL